MFKNNSTYYEQRLITEMVHAVIAKSPLAKRAHLELAEGYARLVSEERQER